MSSKSDASSIASSIASRVSDALHAGNGTSLAKSVKGAKKTLRRMKEDALDDAENRLDGAMEFVRENPLKVILMAAGAGAVLGFMVGRRR